MINESVYKELFVSGSLPGILYGLPKIHKLGVPLRPIFAACKTPAYGLSKFLVPILSPLTKNDYTVSNSYEFVNLVRDFSHKDDYFMVSYDVESLFTNIPLQETIDICLDSLFVSCDRVLNITRNFFKSFLELSVLNSYFIFDNKLYVQKEGVGMGLPLGPTFANIFMCFHENKWLDLCPSEFRPLLYKRYVDDCFVIFKSSAHAENFFEFLNNQHPNINFTMEKESNGQLSFLDVQVKRIGGRLETSVFRKSTFTGQGTSFFSFIPFQFKKCGIFTLIHRAYRLCSTYECMHDEFQSLKSFFRNNGFPVQMIESQIRRFFKRIYEPVTIISTVPKLKMYALFPYFGIQSEKLKKELCSVISNFYPYIDLNIILVNKYTIGSYFKYKDRIPLGCQSSVVYSFSCASCDASYIGSTKRALNDRIQQHRGKSVRTGNWLVNPDPSAIRDHADICGTALSAADFKIIGRENCEHSLRILESLHIHKFKPSLNDHSSATPLHIVG